MPVRLLVPALLSLLLLAAAHAQTRPSMRYCNCMVQGVRYRADKQFCFLNKDNDEQENNCRSEMVRYIPDGYHHNQIDPDRLFKLYNLYANMSVGAKVCSQDGGRLAAPRTTEGFRILAYLMKTYQDGSKGFTGYTDQGKEGVWVSNDGGSQPAPSLPWEPGQPDGGRKENCLQVSGEGRVSDISCHSRTFFLCEVHIGKVPKGYKYHDITRMFYKLHKEEKPYWQARDTCHREGGKLVTIENYHHARSVIDTLGQHTAALVDFTDEVEEGNFVNSKGYRMDDMDFQVWKQGEPDNGAPYGPPENCVAFNSLGYYMDVPCEYTMRFICELVLH